MPLSPLIKKLIFAGMLLAAYVVMHAMGLTFADVWGMAQGEFAKKRAETREFRDTDYSERISREMREEAAKMPGRPPVAGTEGGLDNELANERRRMMDEAANTAAQNRDRMLKGDSESLKQHARDTARDGAGGK